MHSFRSLFAILLLAGCVAPQVRVLAEGPGVASGRLDVVARFAREGILRLAPSFPGTPSAEITIVVHADADSLKEEQRDKLHAGVPGFALLSRNEIHLVLAEIRGAPPNDLRTTVDHELVHILLDQFVGENGRYVPRWFHEGLAQDLAGGAYLDVHEEDLAYRVQTKTYLRFHTLVDGFPAHDRTALALAYGQSFSFVAFLHRHADVGLPLLLEAAKACGPGATFPSEFGRRRSRGLIAYEDEWLEYILASGAGYRAILTNCFLFLVVALVVPLLAVAMARRRNREEWIKRRMEDEESYTEIQVEDDGPADWPHWDDEAEEREDDEDEDQGEEDADAVGRNG